MCNFRPWTALHCILTVSPVLFKILKHTLENKATWLPNV